MIRTLQEKGYTDPSPIQKAAFPELMLGRDLVGQAQTGTGKTAAFALPLLERLHTDQKTPQALVLAPTRELAMQTHREFTQLCGLKGLRCTGAYCDRNTFRYVTLSRA